MTGRALSLSPSPGPAASTSRVGRYNAREMSCDLYTMLRRVLWPVGSRAGVVLAAVGVTSLACVSGCAHRSLVRDRVEHRIDSLRRTATLLIRREQSSRGRLDRTTRWFADQVSAADRWERVGFRLRRSWDAELRRGERIGRTSGPWLRRQLAGRPERIEPVAIRLFY